MSRGRRGYHNIDRHVGFDLPTTYTILKDLATFHSVSLALRIQDPELFDKNVRPHLPRFGDMDPKMQKSFNEQAFDVFRQIPECEPIMENIIKYIEGAKTFGGRPIREPWACVIHMDFWINNVMVTGGKDSKTMILDLQIPLVGTPAADLIFFLLTSVNLDVVKEKLDEFIAFYYDKLIENLKELNVSTENYPFEGLLKEIDAEMKIAEFGHSIGHTNAILAEKGKSDFDSSDENFKIENLAQSKFVANEKQIEKFKWIALESAKRKWI